jgi:outer membrane protein
MRPAIAWILLIVLVIGSVQAQQAPPQKELSLREAIGYALEHSPLLKSAGAETMKRQGNVTTARSSLLPQLDVAGDFSRSRLEHGYPGGTPPGLLRFARTSYSASADLRMLVWDFQKTSLELSAARERVSGSRALEDRRKQEVIFEVAQLYLQALTYHDLLQALEARRKSLASLLDQTNELVKAGRAVPVDAFKIQTQIAQIDSDSATLEAGRRANLSTLGVVMGYEGEPLKLVYSPAKALPPSAAADEQQLVRDATGQRPDLKAARFEANATADLERVARQSRWPRIDFHASAIQYGAENPASFTSLIGRVLPSLPVPNSSASGAVNDWMVGLHIVLPLFDSGRRSGQIKAAAAQTEQARLEELRLKLNIEREVRTYYAELESARTRVKAMRESVVQAREILKNEQAKYEVGRTVINFVLEAEAALLNSESQLFQAQRSEAIAALALDLALGRIRADSAALQQP